MLLHLFQFNFEAPDIGWHFSSKMCPLDGCTCRSRIVILRSWESQDGPFESYPSIEILALTSKTHFSSWVQCAEIPPFTNNLVCHTRKGAYSHS